MSLAECYNYSLDTNKIKIINLIEYTFKLNFYNYIITIYNYIIFEKSHDINYTASVD